MAFVRVINAEGSAYLTRPWDAVMVRAMSAVADSSSSVCLTVADLLASNAWHFADGFEDQPVRQQALGPLLGTVD